MQIKRGKLVNVIFVLIGVNILLFIVLLEPEIFLKFKERFSKEPKPGSCLILEEKYCKKAKLVKVPGEQDYWVVAYKVDKGAVLFSPVDGYYSNTPTFFFYKDKDSKEIARYPGVIIRDSEDNTSETTKYIYSFIFYKLKENQYDRIKKGEIFGTISDKPIDVFGDYNLIVRITKQRLVKGKPVFENDLNLLRSVLKIK